MDHRIKRETVLKPLQIVAGAVERRQTKPILGHVLIKIENGTFSVTATDLEVELTAHSAIEHNNSDNFTLPARKLLDICRNIEDSTDVQLRHQGDRAIIIAGRGRFVLATMPVEQFPLVGNLTGQKTIKIREKSLKRLIEKTAFAMAQQDVRYYLNGLMLEIDRNTVRAVATDGHRLALCETSLDYNTSIESEQIIVPRKGVLELQKLLEYKDEDLDLEIDKNHIRVLLNDRSFTSKLIDGRFPAYSRVIPDNNEYKINIDKTTLQHALSRVSVLSNEKYRGVRLIVDGEILKIQANNPEQEEAEEILDISYSGQSMELGFNVSYLQDLTAVMDGDVVQMDLMDPESSVLVHSPTDEKALYVVMPMRI